MTALDAYRDAEVDLKLDCRPEAIAFAYFHPLSRPHLEPGVVEQCGALQVRGETVLRFGFVEGSAVVAAERAIFDPQGWRDPLEFGANGSEAGDLVLNDEQLRRMARTGSVESAVRELICSGRASVVVVKRGFRRALVIDRSLQSHEIPPYRSERVFKIGPGDVFSARFAYHWGEERCAPHVAAREASIVDEVRAVLLLADGLDHPAYESERANYIREKITERIARSSVTVVYLSDATAQSTW